MDSHYCRGGEHVHGSVLHGFKQFILAREGLVAWETLAAQAGGERWYHATQIYPDQDFRTLVEVTAARWQLSPAEVEAAFGEMLAPVLMNLYQAFVDPRWRTLDLLMNSESVIHRTVRMRDPSASPPLLKPARVGPAEVQIEYRSPRRLCAIAVGLCKGVAGVYRERISVDQPECMERGADRCRLVVRLLPQASG